MVEATLLYSMEYAETNTKWNKLRKQLPIAGETKRARKAEEQSYKLQFTKIAEAIANCRRKKASENKRPKQIDEKNK